MTSRTILLLVAFIVLCTSQLPPPPLDYKLSGEISEKKAVIGNFTVGNLDDKGATLTVTHTHDIVICIVVKTWGLPNYTAYTADNCAYWKQINATTALESNATNTRTNEWKISVASFAFLNTDYTIGIYFDGKIKAGQNDTIKVAITGKQCGAGQFFNYVSRGCGTPKTITKLGSGFSDLFTPGALYLWKFTAPAEIGSFTIAAKDPAVPVNLLFRYMAAPNLQSFDSKGTNTATINYPRPGLWVVALSTTGKRSSQVAFTITGDDCSKSNNTGGPGCKVDYEKAVDNFTLTTYPKAFSYFKFVATPEQGLRVSVTTTTMEKIPLVFASRGQLPTEESHDIANCNAGYCNEVKSIFRNVTTNEVWYIGIKAQPKELNTTAGVWWNTTCVPGCDEGTRGTCLDSGFCKCDPSFLGVDCMINNGMPPQYIVLIIIASLVLASAFIGFVAWAYMRQKRAHYDKI